MKPRQRIANRLSIALVIIVTVCSILMAYAVTRSGTDLLTQAATMQLAQESKIVSVRLQDILGAAERDVIFMVLSPSVQEVVDAMQAGKQDTARIARANNHLQDMFAAFLSNHPWYAQIRLIRADSSGMEVVRVDQENDRIIRVPEAELQEKASRKYVQEMLNEPPGKVYWSPIELNREHGKIVEPVQPVLRAGIPVDGKSGGQFGVLVINLDIKRVFEVASEVVTAGTSLYIANNDGDYLYHVDPEKTFGFQRGQRYLIQDDFSKDALKPTGTSSIVMHDVTLPGSTEAVIAHLSRLQIKTYGKNNLFIALTRPRAPILAEVKKTRQQVALLILPFVLAAAALVFWIVRMFIYPLEKVTHEVSHFTPGRQPYLPEQSRHDEVGQLAQAFARMAARIKQQVAELEEQTRRFSSLFEAVPDAVVMIDQDGTVEYSNPATETLFGYSASELCGQDVRVLMPDPFRSHHTEYMNRYLDGGEPRIIGIGRKVVGQHKNGNTLSLYLSIGEFTLEGRRKFTGILHDISEESDSQ
jgi:two-component system, sensor histidine kinase and response regulator